MEVAETDAFARVRPGRALRRRGTMSDIAETRAYADLRDDWGSAYEFSRWPGTSRPYRAERGDDPTELSAGTPAELRGLVRDDHLRRPVQGLVAP